MRKLELLTDTELLALRRVIAGSEVEELVTKEYEYRKKCDEYLDKFRYFSTNQLAEVLDVITDDPRKFTDLMKEMTMELERRKVR